MSNLRTEHEIEIDRIHDRQLNEQAKAHEDEMRVMQQAFDALIQILGAQIRIRNEIIRDLMAWIDSEFRLDTYLPDSPGKKLWDRAQEAIK